MDVKDTETLLPPSNKATRINWFSVVQPQMRAFHLTWFAFFLAFFGWFGIAPLMVLVRDDLGLSKTQLGNTIIASVAITLLARLFSVGCATGLARGWLTYGCCWEVPFR